MRRHRGRLRRAVRGEPDLGIIRQDQPSPSQPRREPPSEQRPLDHRDGPTSRRPHHPRLQSTTNPRRALTPRDRPLPQAIPRPTHPPNTPRRPRHIDIGASVAWSRDVSADDSGRRARGPPPDAGQISWASSEGGRERRPTTLSGSDPDETITPWSADWAASLAWAWWTWSWWSLDAVASAATRTQPQLPPLHSPAVLRIDSWVPPNV